MDKQIQLYRNGSAVYETLGTDTSSAQSSAFSSKRILIVGIQQDHYIEFGANPTATTSSFILPQGVPMIFHFISGNKVAVRSHSGQGHISVVDMDV